MSQMEVFYTGGLTTRCVHLASGSQIETDASKGVSPTDLFALSLGSCLLTVMGLLAGKLGVDFSGAKVSVLKEMSRTPPRRISSLTVRCVSPGIFPIEIRTQLENAGKECPVHYSLHPDVKVNFSFEWGVL